MRHITQDKLHNCAQTCLAMIANKSIRYIEVLTGTKGLHLEDTFLFCKILQISIGRKWVFNKWLNKLYLFPFNCLIYVVNKHDDLAGHLIVRKKGRVYDPNGTTYYILPERYRVKAYLKIK